MLFNSNEFLFGFLPAVVAGYYLLLRASDTRLVKWWLVASSLFFYGWWNVRYVPLLAASVLFNFFLSGKLAKAEGSSKKWLLLLGICANVLLLGYFKYTDFVIGNIWAVLHRSWRPLSILFPLAISFYTIQQIAFLVDSYEGLVERPRFLDYGLFVLFFPKLISGPIVHYNEMMPQFEERQNRQFNFDRFSQGLLLFFIGFAKKVVLADNLAPWSDAGFAATSALSVPIAWITSLSFTLKVYFDFSGYTDMALGAAMLFNISLPPNFNSPFKASAIINFWQRWHMTLTHFLTTYVFSAILRGFGRVTPALFLIATLGTMLVSGVWHGPSWMFVFFGLLHGVALVINHFWRMKNFPMPRFLGWVLTFSFVNIANIFFRAESWASAMRIVRGMFGLTGLAWTTADLSAGFGDPLHTLILIGVLLAVCLLRKNSLELSAVDRPVLAGTAFYLMLFYSIVILGKLDNHSYVYFKF